MRILDFQTAELELKWTEPARPGKEPEALQSTMI
jgi:hypothetical protein